MIVGLCNGCFDVLHDGHRFFLEEAFHACQYLIIAVNNDPSVRRNKGPGRPIQNLGKRIFNLVQWGLANHPGSVAVIPFAGDDRWLFRTIRPQVMIKGEEYRSDEYWDFATLGHDIKIVWVPRLPQLGSTTERAST